MVGRHARAEDGGWLHHEEDSGQGEQQVDDLHGAARLLQEHAGERRGHRQPRGGDHHHVSQGQVAYLVVLSTSYYALPV